MRFEGKVAVVTGAAQGIGKAIATALAAEGARVVVVDLDAKAAQAAANEIGGTGLGCDLRHADRIADLAAHIEETLGPVFLWCSNAGFARGEPDGPVSAPDAHWQDSWNLHVMAHVRAARAVLPGMIARGEGVLVNVASAAGLLSQIGDAAYSATKHAAVSVAQSLAIEHADDGISVAVVCPQYVATPLLGYGPGDAPAHERVLTPKDVAEATLRGLVSGQFLILPHPEVAGYAQRRAADMDRWISGMRSLRRRVLEQGGDPAEIASLHRLI